MTNISVRIDPELKEIQNETEMNKAKAVLLNEKIRKIAPEHFNSVDIIRKFREERH